MMDKNQALLSDAIERGLEGINELKPESEEYSKAVESVTKLYRMKIEEDKADTEFREAEAKMEQTKDAKKDRWIQVGLNVAGMVLPMLTYSFWMGKVMTFEETGKCTSTVFRTLFNRGIPHK